MINYENAMNINHFQNRKFDSNRNLFHISAEVPQRKFRPKLIKTN